MPSGHCQRARSWVSLALDGELSELEHALLDAHLDRCADCRAFAAGLRGVAAELRAAEPERPAQPVQARRLRRGRSLRILQAGAAAAVVMTAGLGAVLVDVFHATNEASTLPRVQRVSAIGDETVSELRQLKRVSMLAAVAQRSARSAHVSFP